MGLAGLEVREGRHVWPSVQVRFLADDSRTRRFHFHSQHQAPILSAQRSNTFDGRHPLSTSPLDPPLMEPPLDNARHLRYWQRCLRTLLPHQYTANDSTRMTLGCFSVAAADVLTAGPTATSIIPPADRKAFRAWVLACQHPGGGFAGAPTHVFPRAVYGGFDFAAGVPTIGAPGEANIAATLFALQLLALLANEPEAEGDDNNKEGEQSEDKREGAFLGVNRNATLRWLRRLQRADGSFGEYVSEVVDPRAAGGRRPVIGGGADMRYCYIAAMIRWMLGGGNSRGGGVEDIDVSALVQYMRRGQTYDGGFAESSTHESHGMFPFSFRMVYFCVLCANQNSRLCVLCDCGS